MLCSLNTVLSNDINFHIAVDIDYRQLIQKNSNYDHVIASNLIFNVSIC